MRKPPKYVQAFVDRHGKARWYFRRPGFPRIPLPGLPWSPQFMAAYEAALNGAKELPGERRVPPGSVHGLAILYYASADFKTLRPSTQATYRGIIEGMRERCGDLPMRQLERKHIAAMVGKRADTPAAANNELRMWKLLMRCAIEADWIRIDPTAGVRKVRHKTEGFRTWTEDDIAKFEAAYPIGTRERLALALLLYTAARRSDAVRFGPQHVRGGRLAFRQTKTGGDVDIPVHPELAAILAATACEHLTFLVTGQGKPFTPAGFTNAFKDWTRAAGLPAASPPHGLRKAASRRLAEAAATGHQIMSVTGHRSLKEVNRYTEAANRAHLADAAIGALGRKEKAEIMNVKCAYCKLREVKSPRRKFCGPRCARKSLNLERRKRRYEVMLCDLWLWTLRHPDLLKT